MDCLVSRKFLEHFFSILPRNYYWKLSSFHYRNCQIWNFSQVRSCIRPAHLQFGTEASGNRISAVRSGCSGEKSPGRERMKKYIKLTALTWRMIILLNIYINYIFISQESVRRLSYAAYILDRYDDVTGKIRKLTMRSPSDFILYLFKLIFC